MVKDITAVQTQYMSHVKDLLGMRTESPINLIYMELDIPSVQALVRRRQNSFLNKVKNITHFVGSPLQKVIKWQRTPCPLWDSISKTQKPWIVTQLINFQEHVKKTQIHHDQWSKGTKPNA